MNVEFNIVTAAIEEYLSNFAFKFIIDNNTVFTIFQGCISSGDGRKNEKETLFISNAEIFFLLSLRPCI